MTQQISLFDEPRSNEPADAVTVEIKIGSALAAVKINPLTGKRGDWMDLWDGDFIYPMSPEPERIKLFHAHALAHQYRFMGHGYRNITILEHACILHDTFNFKAGQAWALLSQLKYAYLPNLPNWWKNSLPAFGDLYNVYDSLIFHRFNMPKLWGHSATHEAIQRGSHATLKWEMNQLLGPPPMKRWFDGQDFNHPILSKLEFWSPERATTEYYDRIAALGIKEHDIRVKYIV